MQCLLGIDVGNTMVKAVLFDADGNELAVHECGGSTSQPKPGHVERSIAEIRAGTIKAIRGCIAAAAIDPARIVAVGAAGHGNGLYALDHEGKPLLGIQSIDSRAADIVAELEDSGRAATIQAMSLQVPWAAATPVLLAWLKRHDAATYARIGRVLCCKDVVTYLLTGVAGGDVSDAAGAGLIRHPLRRYDAELMALYGIEDALARLPALRESTDVAGHVLPEIAAETGLPVGIPVVAGLFDVVASALGAGVVRLGEASIVAGTWSINQVIVSEPLSARPVFMNSIVGPDRYMSIEASATSAANLDWFVREFEDGRDGSGAARCSERVATVVPAPGLPFYHPYLYAGRRGAAAKAGFYGLSGWHTQADMLYALFEGVTFAHRAHIDRLKHAGAPFTSATLSGGAARSCIWPQMFADVLGIPIAVAACRETGAQGAAICAGVGAGVYADLDDGAVRATRIVRRYEPRAELAALYDERFAMFKRLERAMRDSWEVLSGSRD